MERMIKVNRSNKQK